MLSGEEVVGLAEVGSEAVCRCWPIWVPDYVVVECCQALCIDVQSLVHSSLYGSSEDPIVVQVYLYGYGVLRSIAVEVSDGHHCLVPDVPPYPDGLTCEYLRYYLAANLAAGIERVDRSAWRRVEVSRILHRYGPVYPIRGQERDEGAGCYSREPGGSPVP